MSGTLAVNAATAAPLVGAFTAYSFARRATPGLARLEAPGCRTRWGRNGTLLAAAAVHTTLGSLFAGEYPLYVVAAGGAPGGPWWAYLAVAAGYVALALGAGALAGLLVPSALITPPLVALAFFVYLTTLGLPFFTTPDMVPAASGTGVLLACGALVVISALATRPSPRGSRDVARAALALVAVAALTAASTTADAIQVEREPLRGACTARGEVCVWPEHAHHLDELAAGAARLNSYSNAGLALPTTLHERGLVGAGGSPFDLPPLWFAYAAMGSAASDKVWSCHTEADSVDDGAIRASQELMMWATMVAADGPKPASVGGGPEGVDAEEIAAIRTWPDAQQRDWMQTRIKRVQASCRG